jgi:hypothetical protein
MAALKCPNPSCSFLFDPTQVPPGALLTCPRCGMRFTLGPPPGSAPPPPAPVPAAPPVLEEDTESPEAPRTPPQRRKSGSPFPVMLALGGAMLFLGVIAAALFIAMRVKSTNTSAASATDGEIAVVDKNFAYKMPGSPWEKDPATQNALGVTAFALHRTEAPEAWAALSVSDYETRSPLQAELSEKMHDHLNRLFLDVAPDLALEPTKWAGQDAQKCQFRGRHKTTDTICVGECYLLSYRGIGYWWYAWAAERDVAAVADELTAMRERFRLLDQRKNWNEAIATETVYRSESGKYRLSNFEKIWSKPEGLEPKDEDPKADLLLKGVLKGRNRRDVYPTANLVVLVLADGGDPMSVAGKYVRKRHTPDAELFGPTAITELTGDPVGDPPVGDEKTVAPVARLKVSPGGENASKSAEKLVVYSAIKVGDEVIVAEAQCPWAQRATWERRLMQLVGSLR